MPINQREMLDKLSMSRLLLNPKVLNNQQVATPRPMIQNSQPRAAVTNPQAPLQQPQVNQPRPTFDPSKQGKYEGAFDYLSGGIGTDTIQNQGQWVGGEGGSYQDNFVDTRDHGNLSGMVSVKGRDYGGEDAIGKGPSYQLDYEKMPNQGMTKLGRIDQVYKVDTLNDVLNPNAVVWDDNYGYVTSLKNRKPRLGDKLGPAIAGLAMGGLAGIAGAGTAFGLARSGLSQISSGQFNPMGLGMGLVGAFAPGMGVPSWALQATKAGLGLANLNKGKR